MNPTPEQITTVARNAIRVRDWRTVDQCARTMLALDQDSAEGHFLQGMVEKVSNHPVKSAQAFERTLELDDSRHDAAIELAAQYSVAQRNGEAVRLLDKYRKYLDDSPRYLDMAATTYTHVGLAAKALPLYRRATELQPEADLFRANLAACCVYLGNIDEAAELYRGLLAGNPNHQRNHYYLSRLKRAEDDQHVREMLDVLKTTNLTPDKNIFMYYALGKELEDLGRWDESFEYYKMAGQAVTGVANYDVGDDVQLIETVTDVCTADWLASGADSDTSRQRDRTPIFVLGLPRTGTTLTERIISSHSGVNSIGETQYLAMAIRTASGVESRERMNVQMLEAFRSRDVTPIADEYFSRTGYMFGNEPFFIEKLPHNFLYLGFIARSMPDAKIVHLRRSPMDACFAMYKQVFTYVFKFSYALDTLGTFYIAYDRLMRHWRSILGDRLIEVDYENIIADQEGETRRLLERLDLPFEQACLDFDQNKAPSATASSVQVREKVHARSVDKWKNFAGHLEPLKRQLEAAGIATE